MRPLLILCFGLSTVAAQNSYDRDAYARDYVQFLVLQLSQWSTEFPSQFYASLMKPPVDAGKLSEQAKAGASQLGASINRLAVLSNAEDLTNNAQFRAELEKAIISTKELNQALAAQRFPPVLLNSWDQVRSTLNNLARIYKLETIAVLEPPAAGGKRSPAPAPAGGKSGYIVDLSCAKKGKGMWVNADCVARCIRDGDKAVLVTEDGKIFQIANQEKITSDTYGQAVTIMGKTEGDTITVDSIKI